MNTFNKKYLLLFSLLMTNNHIVNGFTPEFWKFLQSIENIFTEQHNPHQEEKIKEQIANLQHNLNTLPQNEINEIVKNTEIALRKIDLSNPTSVSNAINSELATYIKERTEKEVRILAQQHDIYLDRENYEAIVNKYTDDFIKHLGTLSYITSYDMEPFFGYNRTITLTHRVQNAKKNPVTYQKPVYHSNNHNNHKSQPVTTAYTTYQPSAPQVPSYNNNNASPSREYYAQQHAQLLKQKLIYNPLTHSLSQSDIAKLISLVHDSTTTFQHIPANDLLAHTKQGLAELLDEKLEATRKKLQYHIVNSKKLTDSLEVTRKVKIDAIEKITVDNDRIAQLLGNNAAGESNIEDDVIRNMGIQCPICFEIFKEEHHHGTVNRIILKAADSHKQCGHAVCKVCAPGCKNTCPECRAAVDQQDLAQKMRG